MLLIVILIVVAFALIKAGLAWVVIAAGIGIFLGMRVGRAWGVRQLGAFEAAERLRRMKSKQGGLGIF